MKKICMLFALIVLLTGLAAPDAQAVVIYDNFGPGDTFDTTFGWSVSGVSTIVGGDVDTGASFIPAGTYALDTIEVAAFLSEGTNAVDFYLMTDNAGEPGTIIETFSFVGELSGTGSILLGTSTLNPVLNGGTQYWLVGDAPAADIGVGWNLTDPADNGLFAQRINLGSWNLFSDEIRPAFRINGVPEPATMLLLGFGLIGIGVARKKLK